MSGSACSTFESSATDLRGQEPKPSLLSKVAVAQEHVRTVFKNFL